jgi:hypothetical protein
MLNFSHVLPSREIHTHYIYSIRHKVDLGSDQGITKSRRLSWLTNSALVPEFGGRGGGAGSQPMSTAALIKKKIKFSSLEGSGAKSYMTSGLLYGENICAFPHILGTPSSYMTLHPIPS